jgi:hypothetical protein
MTFTLSEYTLRVIGVILMLVGGAVYRRFCMPPGMRARTLAYVAGVEPDSRIARKLDMFQLIAAMVFVVMIRVFYAIRPQLRERRAAAFCSHL